MFYPPSDTNSRHVGRVDQYEVMTITFTLHSLTHLASVVYKESGFSYHFNFVEMECYVRTRIS